MLTEIKLKNLILCQLVAWENTGFWTVLCLGLTLWRCTCPGPSERSCTRDEGSHQEDPTHSNNSRPGF